ncbi:adenine phosphoribosyltransferase [Thermosipho ferrireducens]|uniref:Adenine phosphoribosyltransferase n=1 Tax=Thermosipho ferrireducens TaxID=2571116 RepID=A0ABX7S5J4_9BACT|nr:adenine phosphoribosyltransferase [Thermosipho ferrireducens]QTA37424.1 adenine phosphoribosyltransferase [Thermosipho ferrireducens]
MDLKKFIRDIPDFPEKGIIFRDITPLLKDKNAFQYAINEMTTALKSIDFDVIAAPEARGFIFGGALAYNLGKSFVPIRKPGKLPYKTLSEKYQLEYGTAELEIHEDAINEGEKVLIFDDVLATGGTAKTLKSLIEKTGGIVAGMAFLIELTYLNPRKLLKDEKVISLITY